MKLSLTRNCHRRMWLATPLFKGPSPGIRRPLFRLVCSPSLVHPRPCTTYAHHLLLLNRPPPPPPCANTDQVKSALNDPQQRPTFATWRPFSTRPRPFTLDFSTRNPPRCCCSPFFIFFPLLLCALVVWQRFRLSLPLSLFHRYFSCSLSLPLASLQHHSTSSPCQSSAAGKSSPPRACLPLLMEPDFNSINQKWNTGQPCVNRRKNWIKYRTFKTIDSNTTPPTSPI